MNHGMSALNACSMLRFDDDEGREPLQLNHNTRRSPLDCNFSAISDTNSTPRVRGSSADLHKTARPPSAMEYRLHDTTQWLRREVAFIFHKSRFIHLFDCHFSAISATNSTPRVRGSSADLHKNFRPPSAMEYGLYDTTSGLDGKWLHYPQISFYSQPFDCNFWQFLPQIQLHEEAQRISTGTFARHLQWNMGCMIRPVA